jgi:hypothetical protein
MVARSIVLFGRVMMVSPSLLVNGARSRKMSESEAQGTVSPTMGRERAKLNGERANLIRE